MAPHSGPKLVYSDDQVIYLYRMLLAGADKEAKEEVADAWGYEICKIEAWFKVNRYQMKKNSGEPPTKRIQELLARDPTILSAPLCDPALLKIDQPMPRSATPSELLVRFLEIAPRVNEVRKQLEIHDYGQEGERKRRADLLVAYFELREDLDKCIGEGEAEGMEDEREWTTMTHKWKRIAGYDIIYIEEVIDNQVELPESLHDSTIWDKYFIHRT